MVDIYCPAYRFVGVTIDTCGTGIDFQGLTDGRAGAHGILYRLAITNCTTRALNYGPAALSTFRGVLLYGNAANTDKTLPTDPNQIILTTDPKYANAAAHDYTPGAGSGLLRVGPTNALIGAVSPTGAGGGISLGKLKAVLAGGSI